MHVNVGNKIRLATWQCHKNWLKKEFEKDN